MVAWTFRTKKNQQKSRDLEVSVTTHSVANSTSQKVELPFLYIKNTGKRFQRTLPWQTQGRNKKKEIIPEGPFNTQ